ncbi:MAG TPA: translation elongation factor Ts [Candidatus Dojkabacteria bacterium]|jgi:elongation factor Ts
MAVTLDQIKELRKRTGVGIHQVKEALQNSDGDMEKAILYLREKGMAKAAKRADKSADYGTIGVYVHGDGNLATMVEISSETDFAARSDQFKELAHSIAMHVAASDPQYVNIEDIPENILENEKKVFKKELEGKPENVQEKILEGKLSKFYEEIVLMEQVYVKDDSKKIKDVINDAVASIGEKIEIGRFARIQIAGGGSSCGF